MFNPLNKRGFRNGWLMSFSARHQFKMSNLHGEGATVYKDACNYWKTEVLPNVIVGYESKDTFNFDEIGVFFTSVPQQSFARPGKKAKV